MRSPLDALRRFVARRVVASMPPEALGETFAHLFYKPSRTRWDIILGTTIAEHTSEMAREYLRPDRAQLIGDYWRELADVVRRNSRIRTLDVKDFTVDGVPIDLVAELNSIGPVDGPPTEGEPA